MSKRRLKIDKLEQDIKELKNEQIKWNDFRKLKLQVECGISISIVESKQHENLLQRKKRRLRH